MKDEVVRLRIDQQMVMRDEMQVESEFLPTRRSLLSRLRDWDDHASWKQFFDTYWKLIYQTAIKSGLRDAEAQDVVQETVISVSKSIRTFRYDPQGGSFKRWLLRLTGWRIQDQYRKRQPRVSDRGGEESGTPSPEELPDPGGDLEAIWDEEWHKNLLEAALQRVRRKVDSKRYQIFDLYVMKKWSVSQITSTVQVSAAQVYLAKHRISSLVRKEIKALESHPW